MKKAFKKTINSINSLKKIFTMADSGEDMFELNQFPIELFIYIFKYLSAKQLMICRRVSRKWRDIIDDMFADDNVWKKHCSFDFPTCYLEAKLKSYECETWFDIYRALSQWEHLKKTTEVIDEFCHSSAVVEEIRSINCLEKGLISVHRMIDVIYYDLKTQSPKPFPVTREEFNKYIETDEAAMGVTSETHLKIYTRNKKMIPNKSPVTLDTVLNTVTDFYYINKEIYFVTVRNHVLGYSLLFGIPIVFDQVSSGVVSMSVLCNKLHVLTGTGMLLIYRDEDFFEIQSISSIPNIMNFLYRYKFIETMEWRAYYVWINQQRRRIPDGPLRFICTIKVYGDLFLVGTQCSIVRIYYKPYINGELNLFETTPVKQYNFSERIDIPILSVHPILKLDVVETKDGHTVLVVMSRKILLIKYTNNSGSECKALLPYEERCVELNK